MKIAFVGTHGVGKTTLCYQLAWWLKRKNLDVELVQEVARRCPLPINRETTLASQEWILHTQMALEIEATSSHEAVVCDRSALDNYCYLVAAAGAQQAWEKLLDRWLATYDLLIHVPLWSPPSFDGTRAVDSSFQRQIDDLLEGMIVARGLRPMRLEAARREQWGADIGARLLPSIEPTLPLFGGEDGAL